MFKVSFLILVVMIANKSYDFRNSHKQNQKHGRNVGLLKWLKVVEEYYFKIYLIESSTKQNYRICIIIC